MSVSCYEILMHNITVSVSPALIKYAVIEKNVNNIHTKLYSSLLCLTLDKIRWFIKKLKQTVSKNCLKDVPSSNWRQLEFLQQLSLFNSELENLTT